jgi:hypothetical protein
VKRYVPTDEGRTEQARHDARHPGKVCQHCPVERAHQAQIEDLARSLPGPLVRNWPLVILACVLAFLVGRCFLPLP